MKKLLFVLLSLVFALFLFEGKANAVSNEITANCFIQPITDYYTLVPTPFSQTFKPIHNHLTIIVLALYGSGNINNDNIGHFKLTDGAGAVVKELDFVVPNGNSSYNFPMNNIVVVTGQVYTITLSKTAQTKTISWGFSYDEKCYAGGQSGGAPWTGDFVFGAYGYNGDVPPVVSEEEPIADANSNSVTPPSSNPSSDQTNQKLISPETAKKVIASTIALPAPTNFQILETGEAYIIFNWDKSQSVLAGYSLEVKHEEDLDIIIDTIVGDASTFKLSLGDSPTLKRGIPYTFSLTSKDANGNVSAESNSVTGSFPAEVEQPKGETKNHNIINIYLAVALLVLIALLSRLIYKRKRSLKHGVKSG